LTDEPAVSTTLTRARFFNATTANDAGAPSPLRVAAVEGTESVPLANAVLEGQFSSPSLANPAVDSLGYWAGTPLMANTPISIHTSEDIDAGAAFDGNVDGTAPLPSWTFASNSSFDLIAPMTNHSGFFYGDTAAGMTLLWCDDTASNTAALNNSCTSVQSP
jgi:hypothetical protein